MHRGKRETLAKRATLILLGVVILAAAGGASWTLPVRVASGQTVPWPTAMPTPGPTDAPLPTSTWTPRPTWTRVPTRTPEQPTPTSTPQMIPPTPTEPVEMEQPTPSPSPTAVRPSPSPTQEPAGLALQVLVEPRVAGPGDGVDFVVQVANVGRGPAEGVKIEGVLSDKLLVRSVDCGSCATGQAPGRLTLIIGHLFSGDQVIASVFAEVIEDVWPGQVLKTVWRVTADNAAPESEQVSLELPWAELPATGWIGHKLAISNWRRFCNRWRKLPM